MSRREYIFFYCYNLYGVQNLVFPRVLLRTYYFTCIQTACKSCNAKQICRAVYFRYNGKVKWRALKNNRKYVYCHSYI